MRQRPVLAVGAATVLAFSLAGLVAAPRPVRADTPPPAQFDFTLSVSNVVPGPGDPSLQDTSGNLFETDTPGELCFSLGFLNLQAPASMGIYAGAAGVATADPPVVDMTDELFGTQCAEGVAQATLDAMAADPAGYYLQIYEYGPDGVTPFAATRGQLFLEAPTIPLLVASWFCPKGTAFPVSLKVRTKVCGGIATPGQGFFPPPGFTSTGFAGTFAFDVEITGMGGYDQDLSDSSIAGGGTCDPTTHVCQFGPAPYFFNAPAGPLTIAPTLFPAGLKLADTEVTVGNETGTPVTIGPAGHVTIDMTGRYQGQPEVDYYYAGPTRLAPPTAFAPTAYLSQAPIAANGGIAVALQYGAIELGNGPVSYTIQASTDGHAFQVVATTNKPFASVRETAGHRYVFRVRATDQFGDTSAWATGSAARLDVIQDTSPALLYSGTWATTKTGSAYGGTTTGSSDSGSQVSLSFTASDVALVMPLAPADGNAQLTVDSQFTPLNLSSATTQPRQEVYLQTFGFVGPHTLLLQPSGNGQIDLDAIVILH